MAVICSQRRDASVLVSDQMGNLHADTALRYLLRAEGLRAGDSLLPLVALARALLTNGTNLNGCPDCGLRSRVAQCLHTRLNGFRAGVFMPAVWSVEVDF